MSARDHVLVRLQHATHRHLEVQAHYVTFTGACPFVPAPLLAGCLDRVFVATEYDATRLRTGTVCP